MSRSAGPGSPISFRCAYCRTRRRATNDGYRVALTGKTKPARRNTGSARGLRTDALQREYRCLSCGHVGWSAHCDLAAAGPGRLVAQVEHG